MNKGVGKKMKILTVSVAVVLCASIGANATNLYVSDIQLTDPGKFYSYSSGVGDLNLPANCSGLMKLEEEEVWNYSLTSCKIYMTSALVQDISSGGYAAGRFATGRTMTITGTLKYQGTSFYTGTILVATMDEPNATWVLAESVSLAINGSAEFAPNTTQGLGSGIAYGSDTLKIGHFRTDFAFKGVTPNPSNFVTAGSLMGTASTIQMVAIIPEPATILLLSTAALALRIRKFKERNR